jgi:hypothetical protein
MTSHSDGGDNVALKTTTYFAAVSALGASLLCAVPASLAAQEPSAAPTQEKEHVVKHGDTLWDLAKTYLNNPFLWPCIYQANRAAIRNPNLIVPTEHLVIPPGCQTNPPAEVPPPPPAPVAQVPRPPEVGIEPTAESLIVPAFEYYAAPWLAPASSLPAVGRLVGAIDPAAVKEHLPQTLHPHDRVYIKYAGTARPAEGDRLLVVNLLRQVKNRGWVVVPTGIVRVDSLARDVLVGTLVNQFRQVLPGFLAIPLDSMPTESAGEPLAVEDGPVGAIVEFLDSHPLYALGDLAFVTLGKEQGLELGDELLAYAPDRANVNDKKSQMPKEPIARMRVVRVDDHGATARILTVRYAALKAGIPVRLSRKMQ